MINFYFGKVTKYFKHKKKKKSTLGLNETASADHAKAGGVAAIFP